MNYQKIPDDVSVNVRYLFQEKGMEMKEICERFPKYPQRTLYRHAKKTICEKPLDKRHKNTGRPQIEKRDLQTSIETRCFQFKSYPRGGRNFKGSVKQPDRETLSE